MNQVFGLSQAVGSFRSNDRGLEETLLAIQKMEVKISKKLIRPARLPICDKGCF
jgi:hypothetical protein